MIADSNSTTTRVSRRAFLGGAAAATVATTAAAISAPAGAQPRPVTEERRRAVVIGSGFGGAIAALHLGRAGVDTVVLERGIRWPTGPNAETFPRMLSPDQRSAWLQPHPVMTGAPPAVFPPFTGLMERIPGNGMDILCGAGVGGGSLVYHGMTMQPNGENFAKCVSPRIDYEQMASEYYPRVARTLRIATIPDDLLNSPQYSSSRRFVEMADAQGLHSFRVPMPIDWEFARRELRGEMRPSYTNGDVIYGVNNGGKFSVDVTYLAAAEATGKVEVAPLHRVNDIERGADGTWIVHCDRIGRDGTVLERKRVASDALFLGAGSPGTTRLLVKARAKNAIPDLPDGVGTGWGNNGDRIFMVTRALDSPGAWQGGPACVGVKDWDNPAGALTIVLGPVPFPLDLHTTSVIGYGVVEGLGSWHYDSARDDAVLTWNQAYDRGLTDAIRARIEQIVGAGFGVSAIDVNAFDTNTFHPLGGAPFETVCDDAGRVHGQRGLYVLDGARIPGSTGACNPSMTIAALAEYSMDLLVAHDVDTVF
ncbi:cholesterol oxidase [Rhodococcus hoagii]|uniref:GMC oxidoreductase n=1 Tax=Rhodococcus hoagii TaxID=43767 RepID=UPI0019E7DB69|nr:GMC oxidoreductase [Prescottella equi]NKS51142.1 cholesterol oxidase [Prescottella equi]WJJ13683.1 GMC oxidoreductase [Prescottella equi]